MSVVRWSALLVLIVFSAYTIYVTKTESFFKSLKAVWKLKWGKQALFDLYVGLFLFNFIVFLNEDSGLVALTWLICSLILGNPVTLLYFVVNFDKLMSHFL